MRNCDIDYISYGSQTIGENNNVNKSSDYIVKATLLVIRTM